MTLSDAAARIGVSAARVQEWESGEERPSIAQLRKAATVYGRTSAVFYLDRPPPLPAPLHDFRRLAPRSEASAYSPALWLEVRNARRRRQLALDLMAELDEDQTNFTLRARLDDDAERLGARVREALLVDDEQVRRWSDDYMALAGWIRAVENLGILVFQTSGVPVSEMRGFSIAEDRLPVVVLNGKDAATARVFTLFHELTHLMLRKPGLCGEHPHESRARSETDRVEVFCNRVAAAVVLPKDAVECHELVRNRSSATPWTEPQIRSLAFRFHVSPEVVLRRLHSLGRLSWERLQSLAPSLRAPGVRRGGRLLPDQKAVRNNGPAFSRLVLAAYYDEAITGSDVSEYLDVKLKHLDKIERRLFIKPDSENAA